jgi:helicase required for RNAi-mediated heterochromatin assembly 1
MNVELVERFTQRSRPLHRRDQHKISSHTEENRLHNTAIRQYLEQTRAPCDPCSWVSASDIPTTAEIFDVTEPWQRVDPVDASILLQGNNLQGPWPCKNDYLMAHYEMLREEEVRPLREAVHWVKNNPSLGEDQRAFGGNMGIYEKVCDVTLTQHFQLTCTGSHHRNHLFESGYRCALQFQSFQSRPQHTLGTV